MACQRTLHSSTFRFICTTTILRWSPFFTDDTQCSVAQLLEELCSLQLGWLHCAPALDRLCAVFWLGVMETHCQIPPGAITVEETNLFRRKSVPSGPRPQRRPSDRWKSRGPLVVFKLEIPLWSIQDKCQIWYLVCTSSTSCLCQLMKQQEVCWVMALFYSYKVTRTKSGETLKISCSLLNLSNRFCWKGIFKEPLLAYLIILTWN